MTKKGKILIYSLIIVCFLLKEEIYAFFYKASLIKETNASIKKVEQEELEEKYKNLLNAYGYNDQTSYHLEHSKILYRDIYKLENQITIFKGSEDGIQEKNLVVNERGLIGIVSITSKNSSVVDLLCNESLNLSVKINNEYGILKYKNKEFVVEGINNKGVVEVGDKITTSDISLYPENVPIGTVSEIDLDSYEIEKRIKVTPVADFNDLKYVSVITFLRGES